MKLLTALLLLAAAVDPTPEIRYFNYQRTVEPPTGASGQTCAVLDTQTFVHASPGLADLRLYRDASEVPYVIHSEAQHLPAPRSISPLNRGRRNGRTVFDADMPEGEYSDLHLNVTGENFLATVTVSGSQSETGAATRIGTYTIFDFTGQKLGRSTVLHFPSRISAYFTLKSPDLSSPITSRAFPQHPRP